MHFRPSSRYASPYAAAALLRETATVVAVGYNSTRTLKGSDLVVSNASLATLAHDILSGIDHNRQWTFACSVCKLSQRFALRSNDHTQRIELLN